MKECVSLLGRDGYSIEDVDKMYFEGRLGEVVDRISSFGANENYTSVDLFLDAGRLMRGVLDSKIEAKIEGEDSVKMINLAVDSALRVCKGESSVKICSHFVDVLDRIKKKYILSKNVFQPRDSISWKGFNPEFSYVSAKKLSRAFSGDDLLFLGLGHGGVVPCLDVFSMYEDISSSKNSIVYPVRFSREKFEDPYPMVNEKELEYLVDVSRDRHVVIFDEDSFSGITARESAIFFRQELGKSVNFCANSGTCGGLW